MNLYEIAYLITADASEFEAKEIENQLIALLQGEGGFILSQNSLLRKKLSYPIKKQAQAYLADIVFKLPAEKVTILEKKLKSDNKILRHLLLAKKELKLATEKKKRMPLHQKLDGDLSMKETTKEKKVELKDIDRKLEEILEQ